MNAFFKWYLFNDFFSLHVWIQHIECDCEYKCDFIFQNYWKMVADIFQSKTLISLSLSRQSEQTSTYNRLLQCTTPSLTWASSEKICRCYAKDSFLIPMPFVFSINWIIERNVFQSTFSCRHRKHCFDLNIDYISW